MTIEKHMVWFFPGGETSENHFNVFTGSFIRLMKEILGEDFEYIKGVNYRYSLLNVIWALNNAQKPLYRPEEERMINNSFKQIIEKGGSPDTQLVIVSSSSGSIIAAQTACYLAHTCSTYPYFKKPFHLVLGASMVSPDSDLFRQLLRYQEEGRIGIIIHDEIQDAGDNAAGVGGKSRIEAYRNALGIVFPVFSRKFSPPSFLNTHPEKGHIHRRRSQTVRKALDYIDIILIRNKLAGIKHMKNAIPVVLEESRRLEKLSQN